MAFETPSLIAGGDINPARFVTLSTSANQTVVESNASDTIIVGISSEATKAAPMTGASTLAAADGDHIRVHTAGEICKLKMDATGCAAGAYLKPDNSGMGDVATSGDDVGALALEAAAGGELVTVMVLPPGTAAP